MLCFRNISAKENRQRAEKGDRRGKAAPAVLRVKDKGRVYERWNGPMRNKS